MPRALLMVSDASGDWVGRYDANRTVDAQLVELKSRVRAQTGPIALDAGAALLQVPSSPS